MLRSASRSLARKAAQAVQPARAAIARSALQFSTAFPSGPRSVAADSAPLLWVAAAAAAGFAGTAAAACEPARQRSFVMVKPDGVGRQKIAEIIRRFEDRGYKLVGIKVLVPSKELAGEHYGEHEGKPFYEKLVTFLSSGAVVAMVWEGDNVITAARSMLGSTDPQKSAPGTIRGDLGITMGRNLIHVLDSQESAQKEIGLWFTGPEIAEYKLASDSWIYE